MVVAPACDEMLRGLVLWKLEKSTAKMKGCTLAAEMVILAFILTANRFQPGLVVR